MDRIGISRGFLGILPFYSTKSYLLISPISYPSLYHFTQTVVVVAVHIATLINPWKPDDPTERVMFYEDLLVMFEEGKICRKELIFSGRGIFMNVGRPVRTNVITSRSKNSYVIISWLWKQTAWRHVFYLVDQMLARRHCVMCSSETEIR